MRGYIRHKKGRSGEKTMRRGKREERKVSEHK